MLKKAIPFIVSILIALSVGGISALITVDNMSVYTEIIKPALAPPAIIFPIVWTILYVLMGVSAAMIFNQRENDTKAISSALKTYTISLVINFFWSPIFFNRRNYLFACIWLILLWISVFITILKYKKIKPVAAFLQIPYLLWCSFAAYLSLSIYLLN